jgi:carbamoyl-phosphate synthase large subunit
MNVQFAIHDEDVYVLEVNPRASRTVPFVSKATGRPLAKIAARVMSGKSLSDQGFSQRIAEVEHVSVKEAVLPFNKFAGADGRLGPEMKSTGEVMGIGATFGEAFLKAQLGAGSMLPSGGKVFLSVNDRDKEGVVDVARRLQQAGFSLIATDGTQVYLAHHGIDAERILKIHEGRPHVEDAIRSREICLVINSPQDEQSQHDDTYVRRAAILHGVPYTTTLSGAVAAATGIEALQVSPPQPRAVQDYHRVG